MASMFPRLIGIGSLVYTEIKTKDYHSCWYFMFKEIQSGFNLRKTWSLGRMVSTVRY